jgi:hypothetical protein
MTKWSAIIYSPTYEVDFRFLAIPDDFDQDDREWVKRHIDLTMKDSTKLRNSPNWSILRNKKHFLLSVTCMAKDLMYDNHNLNKDKEGRDVYLFIGYVTELNSEDTSNLSLTKYLQIQDLSLFQQLINGIIEKKWYEKTYNRSDTRKIEYTYTLSESDNSQARQVISKLLKSLEDCSTLFDSIQSSNHQNNRTGSSLPSRGINKPKTNNSMRDNRQEKGSGTQSIGIVPGNVIAFFRKIQLVKSIILVLIFQVFIVPPSIWFLTNNVDVENKQEIIIMSLILLFFGLILNIVFNKDD